MLQSQYHDSVQRHLAAEEARGIAANLMLAHLLEGCVHEHPGWVQLAMRIRNALVRPWRLLTSSIGCPVSSLLDQHAAIRFAGSHPVRRILQDDDQCAEVMLGADDRHLTFRTLMKVERLEEGGMRVSMATTVQTLNRFGWLYMCLVDPLHRRWIAPAILDAALGHARMRAGLTDLYPADIPRYAV